MNNDEKRMKHLEFIQSNIVRMNQCSFQMKGWMIALVSALLALYASSVNAENGDGNNIFVLIAIIPTFLFWILDSYYLQQERKFRALYNDIADLENSLKIKEFYMPLENYNGCRYCLFRSMFSTTEVLLYFPIIIGLVVARILL